VLIHCGVSVRYQLDPTLGDGLFRRFAADDQSKDDAKPMDPVEELIRMEVSHSLRSLIPRYPLEYILLYRMQLENNIGVMVGQISTWEAGPVKTIENG
jgi:hypothetical protein